MCIYMYIYMCVCVYMCIKTYIHNVDISHYHGIWEFHILMGVSWSWYSSILKVSLLHEI